MTLYADTPRWQNHGTSWGHLISDSSLEELHAGAAAAGLPSRAFDLDHYDWPLEHQDRLESAGVRMVGNRELTRLLLRSGLRVPGVRRAEARRERSADDARRLGLSSVPRDLIWGMFGHADPLPDRPGAFRISREEADGERIQASDGEGRRRAQEFLREADRLARRAGSDRWIGQVMDAP